MSQSVVSLIINARNLAGGVFQQLQNQAGATATAMGKLFGGQTSGAANAGNAITALAGQYFLLNKAAEAATFAFTKLQQAGSEAIQRQVEQVSALSTAMQTLGLSQREAGRYTQDIETKIANLGKDLPTSAENIQVFFRTIQDDYNLALKGAGASLDTIKKAQLGTSSRIALLSDLAGGDTGATRAAISAFLGGSVGARGLNQYSFFANNPQLANALKTGLTAKGVSSTSELSSLERVKLLTQALEKAVTPEMIQLLQGTVKARLSAFMDSLFDPTIGLFSIQRDLEPKIDGYQSVFTAFGDTLDILIGNNGIIENLTRLLGLGGIDPMRALYDGVNALNSWLLGISGTLTQMKSLTATQIGGGIGQFLAQGVNVVLDGILNFLGSIDYGALLQGVMAGIASFFLNLDWKVYAVGAGALIAAFFAPMVTSALVAVGGLIVAGITAVVGGIPLLIGGAIVLGVAAIVKLVTDNWQTISAFVTDNFSSLKKTFFETIDNIGKTVGEFFGGIQKRLADLVGGLTNPQQAFATPSNAVATTTIATSVAGPLGGLLGLAGSVGGFLGSFFSRADGFIPASGGLLSAIANEAARKPANSDFVIANSSEAILNRNQLNNLTGNLLNSGSKTVNFQPGAIVFNLPPGTPQEIAMAAIEIMERALQQELETRIA